MEITAQQMHAEWVEQYEAATRKKDARVRRAREHARQRLAQLDPGLGGADFKNLAHNWYVCGPNQWQKDDPAYPERRRRVLEILETCEQMERAAYNEYHRTTEELAYWRKP